MVLCVTLVYNSVARFFLTACVGPEMESIVKKCHRCDRPAPYTVSTESADVPLCLGCRLKDLRDELERRSGGPHLLTSFPEGTTAIPGGSPVRLEGINMTNDAVRDPDPRNIEIMYWAINLLKSDPEWVSAGNNLSGLADVCVRPEMTSTEKDEHIQNIGILALDRVAYKLLKALGNR